MEKLIFLIVIFLTGELSAHQGESHGKKEEQEKPVKQNVLNEVDQSYRESIASIFEKKCMDCHGEPKKLPWYYVLPIAKNIIDADMQEANEHLDLRGGFPFKGHGTPLEDLEAIQEVVRKDEMPPFRYKIMHWSSQLTKAEKKVVEEWVERGKILLGDEEK